MSLRAALGLNDGEEFNPASPFALYEVPLGSEAADVAESLLNTEPTSNICLIENNSGTPEYLLAQDRSGNEAELCRLAPFDPDGTVPKWPTAAEIALVRCAQLVDEADFRRITDGKTGFCIYDSNFPIHYLELIETIRKPETGPDNLSAKYSTMIFRGDVPEKYCRNISRSLSQSFETKPIKYRYIEIYRIFESAYLKDAYEKFSGSFFNDPEAAVNAISSTIKNERSQLYSLVEKHEKLFEDISDAFEDLKKSGNTFAFAINRSMEKKYKGDLSPKWKKGASLVYAIRCAIVHAGEKDVVFEGYNDGSDAIDGILPSLELASLALVGIEMAM